MSISIIIPSTGERTTILLETLEAALRAVEPVEAEIIVIKKKEKLVPFSHPKLRLVDVDFNNVSASRNLGAKLAKYELLFFIDDDINITTDNLRRLIEFESLIATPYVVSAIWRHSSHVQELRQDTFLGQMLATYFPDDSFKMRYLNVAEQNDWQDDTYFKSGMKAVFWELCFSMRRSDYLRIGGMNEHYNFGNEGVDFLKRLLAAGMSYYVDATNIVSHNEWDKFNDWRVPEKRWQVEAQLINDEKGFIAPTYKNYLYKLVYGIVAYLFKPLLQKLLHSRDVRKSMIRFYFKLFDIYLTSIYWHQINWKTLIRLQQNEHRVKTEGI
jgi:GT2 family glycosyltransferase